MDSLHVDDNHLYIDFVFLETSLIQRSLLSIAHSCGNKIRGIGDDAKWHTCVSEIKDVYKTIAEMRAAEQSDKGAQRVKC